jgi:CheY-like chemotaxis protein
MSEYPRRILLVEDDPGNVRLAQEAFKESAAPPLLDVVDNGEDAMAFLRGQGRYGDAVRPDLILLDLNLPKKNGHEVLVEIKSDTRLRCIPVIILTTSSNEQDVIHTYNNSGNCYITKPADLDDFMRVIGMIERFWLSLVTLPPRK